MNITLLLHILLSPYNLETPNVVWQHSLHNIMFEPALGAAHCVADPVRRRYDCTIYLMSCLQDTPKDFREHVITHEAAHIVDYLTDGKGGGHGGQWAQVMRKWNQDPDGLFNFDDVPKVCQDALLNPTNI